MSEGQRRLAAIMFTDIVGYTALSQRNEKLALQLLEGHRSLMRHVFARHKGREVKTTGDGFLIQFESALDAVECAVEMQKAVHNQTDGSAEKLEMKVGIHVGDVVQSESDVHGDAVNIASRIEPLAKGGEICISQQVYDQVRNKVPFKLVKLERHELKNVTVPIDVYRVEMPWEEGKAAPTTGLDKNRIAVLPFANMSADPNDEYFADGMTEELITAMSGLQGLQVIARTSVMNYKGEKTKLSTIGNDLRVGTVLEGSVRKTGNRVRVTAQLIDVPTESHLWSEKYDRELDDIFRIQDDIAGKISEALSVRLATKSEPVRRHAENIEAYTLYLKGRSLWNKRDKQGVLESLVLFQEAINADPDYARAYAGLADAYNIASTYGFMDRDEGQSKSREAATKALELDNTLAEAHASLGACLEGDLRYGEALKEYEKAVELNPSYATARQWYSECLLAIGRMKEATEQIEKARELDPLSPIITLSAGATYGLVNGRLDEAIATVDKLIEREPAFARARSLRSYCFAFKGIKERAYADWEEWYRLVRDEDGYKAGLVFLDLWFGERERAQSMIEELISKVGKSSVKEWVIADCYALIGNRDEFFKWIDKEISAKVIFPMDLRYLPVYDKVREDPRFPEVFKRLGLPY